MSTTAIRDQLRAMPFLEGLTDSAYHQLARLVGPVRYETDEVLFEEGQPRSFLAMVVSGAVAIEKQMNGRPHRLVTLGAGKQLAKVVFDTAGSAGVANLNWIRVSPAAASPYSGTPIALPGTVAADQFDNGGAGIAYIDSTAGNSGGAGRATDVDLEPSSLGGNDIGWISDGEWVTYTVNVASAGSYTVTATVASPYDSGRLRAATVSSTRSALGTAPAASSFFMR